MTTACHEEIGWWHLLLVTGDDRGFASSDRSDGFACGDLAGLIENDQVEIVGINIEILGNGGWRHQKARAESPHKRSEMIKNLTERDAASTVFDEFSKLINRRGRCACTRRRI